MLVSIGLAACGGSDGGDDGEPLVAGAVDGDYAGQSFTAAFGFSTDLEETPIIGFGDGDSGIHCGSVDDREPPPGHYAFVALDTLEVGSHSGLFVMIYSNVDDYEAIGTGGASVELTEVSDASVAGTIAWEFTDPDDSAHYGLSGSFEVIRCD